MGTFWEPFGNLEGTLRNLGNLGNLERTLGTLGTFTWEPGNLYLGTWEPLLGNLYLGTFTWNLGTLGEWVLELLRSAPKPLLWLKTPKHSAVGEKSQHGRIPVGPTRRHCRPLRCSQCGMAELHPVDAPIFCGFTTHNLVGN